MERVSTASLINGLSVAASFNDGGVSTFIYDVVNTDEMQVLVSGGLGESEAGGPSVNLIPRSGGNSFNGSAFYSGTGDGLRSDNIDDYLSRIGLTRPPALLNQYDVSGALGGPSCATGCGSSVRHATRKHHIH